MGKDRFAALFAKDLQREINVDIVTVRSYNKLLQDAKILYIHKNNTFYNTQTQEMEHLPSTYGSYKFKQEIEEFNKAMIDKITFNKSKFKQKAMKIDLFVLNTDISVKTMINILLQKFLNSMNKLLQEIIMLLTRLKIKTHHLSNP